MISIFLWIGTAACAQSDGTSNRRVVDYRSHITYYKVIGKPNQPISGLYYPDDEFKKGVILIGDDLVSDTLMMRCHKLNDAIEIKSKGEVFDIRPTSGASEVHIGKLVFVSEAFEFKGVARFGFFESLKSGRSELLTKEIYKPDPDVLQDAASSNQRMPFYVPVGSSYLSPVSNTPAGAGFLQEDFERRFYYTSENTGLSEIKKLKKFIHTLPSHRSELLQYSKKKRLQNNREGLVALFNYYDSLTKY
ncbi:hypothetical protein IMPR6_150128 [Imperialibacter sp. EC-SDR9]|nr:hypothetical protein IMPERIA75_130047 [Imperialibacter sp. 75]CAD5286788.1 hypothetical protein IMPERIA89_530130 [Imperialibacter sp. 89]VVT05799.1 hypothetical protein IMPR6_150128 [Imperialibacter sp. EC-SDR9]